MKQNLETQFAIQLERMVVLQQKHNVAVHPAWEKQNYPFNRAVWVECAELLDHYGWKWWKKQEVNLDQVYLEIVDIWHFGLSDLMERDIDLSEVVTIVLRSLANQATPIDFRTAVEELAARALAGNFDVASFAEMMRALPMSLNQLFGIYIGKNVLNRFRQANGYKDGSYRKNWHGREDNECLAELVSNMDALSDDFEARLMEKLEVEYESTVE